MQTQWGLVEVTQILFQVLVSTDSNAQMLKERGGNEEGTETPKVNR